MNFFSRLKLVHRNDNAIQREHREIKNQKKTVLKKNAQF